jgi:N-methylhydantoinase B/oxoprolinase/acetone carboxylase alpha subunit
MTRALDAVLARVLARAFSSICAEMGHATIRTAVSAVFVEGRDFSCALLDPRAELVAAANFDPSHLSAMPLTAEYALMELGHEELREGDVIVVNDPYRGGGHLTDIAVLRPVFAGGELLGLAMNRGHHIDVGGMAVAGFPGTARSIFQEGLRIPPVKWFEGGVERRQVMDLILLNVRFPQAQLGDFQAQLASCVAAEQRMRALVDRYGLETTRAAMQEAKDHSERLMRHAIAAIPDGAYRFADLVDDDGVGGGPYRIAVELRVEGDDATIDFAGTSAQAEGPINSSYGNTVGSCFNAFLHAFGAGIDFNGGCFKPIRFAVPRGSFLNPVPPAPVFGGVTEVSIRVIDAISGALAQAVPGSVAAASYGTCLNVAGGGFDAVRGRDFGFYFFQEGGWGATAWRDGWTSVPNPTSNFNDFPVEVLEEELPLRCLEVALHEGSGGAGRYRGGLGTRRAYELLADGCELNALGERFTVAPYGLAGGAAGRPNALLHARAGEQALRPFAEAFAIRSPSKFAALPLRRGDRFALVTGGGGGYGDPLARPPADVAADVGDGLVSTTEARELYGVVLTAHGVVDAAATAALRATPRAAAPPAPAPEVVPPPAAEGRAAEDAAAAARLATAIRARIGDDPCRTTCPKRGDRIRCPFHHPFALDFWDAAGLERWALRHCPIARALREGPSPP